MANNNTILKTRRTQSDPAARWLRWLGVFGCALGSSAAMAADAPAKAEAKPAEPDFTAMSLEDLGAIKVPTVVGASKHEQKITEAPSSVTIVTRQDIQEYGHRTPADVLNSVRGLYVTYDRAYTFLGIRGVNRLGDFGGRTLLNINGHRINEPIYDSSFFGYEFPLDVDLIDHVEIISGTHRRRRYTVEEKVRLVEQTMQPGMTQSWNSSPSAA